MRDPTGSGGLRRASAGFTLIEVSVAVTIAAVAIGGLMAAVTSAARLQVSTQSFDRASRAIQEVHESLRNGDLDARVAEFKGAPVVQDGPVTIQVSFPEQVLEDLLGTPIPLGWRYRDLDADGEVDLDGAATAGTSLVPVTVLATWNAGSMRNSFLVTEK